jgi:hypothetical protein
LYRREKFQESKRKIICASSQIPKPSKKLQKMKKRRVATRNRVSSQTSQRLKTTCPEEKMAQLMQTSLTWVQTALRRKRL